MAEMTKTCPECRVGTMTRRKVTLSYDHDGILLEIQDVPAFVCSHCGKRLISGDVAHQVSELLQQVEATASLQRLSEDVARLRRDVTQVRRANLELAYA